MTTARLKKPSTPPTMAAAVGLPVLSSVSVPLPGTGLLLAEASGPSERFRLLISGPVTSPPGGDPGEPVDLSAGDSVTSLDGTLVASGGAESGLAVSSAAAPAVVTSPGCASAAVAVGVVVGVSGVVVVVEVVVVVVDVVVVAVVVVVLDVVVGDVVEVDVVVVLGLDVAEFMVVAGVVTTTFLKHL